MLATLKNYYDLTKPRLVYGNLITTATSFIFASHGLAYTDIGRLGASVIGTTLVMASGCVINNLIDRDIDKIMERTKTRASAQGKIRTDVAIIFAALLLSHGLGILITQGIGSAATIIFIGWIFYVVVYSLWGKRHSVYGTFIGAVAGATPALAGYAAGTSTTSPSALMFDASALAVFLMMLFWQMPHAWAIALYRKSDYAKAKIPVLPVTNSELVAPKMSQGIVLFGIVALLPYALNRAGIFYATVALLLTIRWWVLAHSTLPIKNIADESEVGRRLFRFSLLVVMGVFIVLMFDSK